jgi:hypothetical protein
MKKFFAVVMMALVSISATVAFAGGGSVGSDKEDELSRSADVGVRVIARSVVDKKLVDKESRSVLILALETGRASFGAMECDRAVGTDGCAISVFVHDDPTTDEAEETVYQLDVNIYQGTVKSAKLELIAG